MLMSKMISDYCNNLLSFVSIGLSTSHLDFANDLFFHFLLYKIYLFCPIMFQTPLSVFPLYTLIYSQHHLCLFYSREIAAEHHVTCTYNRLLVVVI